MTVKVRDMLRRLRNADPDAVVLWRPPWADASDAEETCEVVLVHEAWTCERHGATDGSTSDAHHPSGHGLSLGWDQSTDEQWTERVVILSPVRGASYE
jgi:hypothetical protein